MPSTLRRNGDVAVLEVEGKLRLGPDMDEFRARWSEAVATGTRHLVVVLARAPMVDSSALGTLIRAQSALKATGGSLRLAGVSQTVLTAMQVARLDKVFLIYPDEAAALAALAAQHKGAGA